MAEGVSARRYGKLLIQQQLAKNTALPVHNFIYKRDANFSVIGVGLCAPIRATAASLLRSIDSMPRRSARL